MFCSKNLELENLQMDNIAYRTMIHHPNIQSLFLKEIREKIVMHYFYNI